MYTHGKDIEECGCLEGHVIRHFEQTARMEYGVFPVSTGEHFYKGYSDMRQTFRAEVILPDLAWLARRCSTHFVTTVQGFSSHPIPRLQPDNTRSYLLDDAGILMPQYGGKILVGYQVSCLTPKIMKIRPANPGRLIPHQYPART
jgi:hypothetical protein